MRGNSGDGSDGGGGGGNVRVREKAVANVQRARSLPICSIGQRAIRRLKARVHFGDGGGSL